MPRKLPALTQIGLFVAVAAPACQPGTAPQGPARSSSAHTGTVAPPTSQPFTPQPRPTPTGSTGEGTVASPAITPAAPVSGVDALSCTAEGIDPSDLSWEHEGTAAGAGSQIDPWSVRPGTWACLTPEGGRTEVEAHAAGHNLILVLIDDLGVDRLASYGLHPEPTPTPTLDELANAAVQFDVAYAAAQCSPARTAMLTGKLMRRTGVGTLISPDEDHDWLADHPTFPTLLQQQGYATSLVGKWHQSSKLPVHFDHPAQHGFDSHRGTNNNPGVAYEADHLEKDYFEWQENQDGVLADRTGYLTTATIDDAIAQLDTLPEPFLLYLPLNAPHAPLHVPPAHLIEADPDTISGQQAKYDAMVEAMDTELARFLDALNDRGLLDRSTLIVAGDNGSQDHALRPPSPDERSKKTVYEAGVRVPMWVVSPLVSEPGRRDALVHLTDVFATARDLAGAPIDGELRDSISLLPYLVDAEAASQREVLFSELFIPNGEGPYVRHETTVRNRTHKLIVDDGVSTLYRLDPAVLDEGEPVGAPTKDDEAALAALEAELAALEATFP